MNLKKNLRLRQELEAKARYRLDTESNSLQSRPIIAVNVYV